jgi:hypothetical protein
MPLLLTVWEGELTQQVVEGSRESSAPHFYVEIPPAWHSGAEEREEILRVAHCVTRTADGRVQTESACNYLQQVK